MLSMKNHTRAVSVYTLRRLARPVSSEHKNAVKNHNTNNGLAAQAWTNQHRVDWKAAKTREMEGIILEEEVLEALHIH